MKKNVSVTIFRLELAHQRQYKNVRKDIFDWAGHHGIPKVADVPWKLHLANPSVLVHCDPPYVREMFGSHIVLHLLDPDSDLSNAVASLCAALDRKKVPYHRSEGLILTKEEILALDWVWMLGAYPGADDFGAHEFTTCDEGPAVHCPGCGGIVEEVTQASDLSVSPEYLDPDGRLPRDFANASNGALLLSSRAHDWMRAHNLKGFTTRPVRRQGGKRLVDVVQFQAKPHGLQLSQSRHAVCPTSCLVCGRDASAEDPIHYFDQDPYPASHFMADGPRLFVRGAVARALSESDLTGLTLEVGFRILKPSSTS